MDKPIEPPAAPPAPEAPQAATPQPAGSPNVTIDFKETETTVPLSMKEKLDALAKQLTGDESKRVTLTAYASNTSDQASTARRVSLSRALSVRAYLIDAGITNTRINVQAQGDKNPGGNPDRVDIIIHTAGEKTN